MVQVLVLIVHYFIVGRQQRLLVADFMGPATIGIGYCRRLVGCRGTVFTLPLKNTGACISQQQPRNNYTCYYPHLAKLQVFAMRLPFSALKILNCLFLPSNKRSRYGKSDEQRRTAFFWTESGL